MSGAVDGELTDETMAACDVILLAVRPAAAIEWLKITRQRSTRTPSCSTAAARSASMRGVLPNREEYGVTFLGGHPMAVRSTPASRTRRRPCIMARRWSSCRRDFDDIELLSHVKDLLRPRASRASPSRPRSARRDDRLHLAAGARSRRTRTSRALRRQSTRAFPPAATRI